MVHGPRLAGLFDVNFDDAQTGAVVTWGEFQHSQPDMAKAAHALLYQFGVGLAFLATVRRDGGPRVHPMCPLIHDGGMYAFIVPGPKQADLHRDGRYSLHSFPCEDNEDAFYCTGRVQTVDDPAIRRALAELFVTERSSPEVLAPKPGDHLFSFDLHSCLLTRTTGHGDPSPEHTVWHQANP
jgi:hypothetical protein